MQQSSEADPSGALENRSKADIRRSATWLLGGQVDQLVWTERSMQQTVNDHRPHRTLHQAAPLRPLPSPASPDLHLPRRDRLGGLIHEYAHVA
jgi:hypothetical protein